MTTVMLLGGAGLVAAQQPTVSDVALCNQEAEARTRGPSAYPGPRPQPAPEPKPKTPDAPRGLPPTELPRHSPPARGAEGEKTDPSGSVITESPDALLEGMDASRADDPAYRVAYRTCMERQRGRAR